MEFRVLGPLDVLDAEGNAVEIPRRLARSVLVVLLLNANRAVAVDSLAEQVWHGRPPGSAAANLRGYIYALRRVLGDRIATERGGYALRVDDGELDATVFEHLIAEGGRAASEGQHAVAVERLTRARGMWRGQALAGMALPDELRPELARLEELRCSAIEDSLDARLAMGQHTELVAELAALTRQYPLRERLWGQRMLALYRSGRQADALAAYEEARRLLADELGIDPSPRLRELHQRILCTDSALSPPARATTPAQLPGESATFLGRDEELAILDRLTPGRTVVVSAIDGMAGVGKTALAVRVAHRLAPDYPDGQLFVDLRGFTDSAPPLDPAQALERMLRALGMPGENIPAGIDEQAALYRSTLADTRTLVVLDNARCAEQVAPLLPGTAGCLVLVTSRNRLSELDTTCSVFLDVLSRADAVSLFTAVAGADRVGGEHPDRLAEVVELCDRLPLAVRIAAARLRAHPTWTVSRLVARLREQQTLPGLATGQRTVAAALDLSYQQLEPAARAAYRLLGTHPGQDIEPGAAAALLGEDATALLEHLLNAHLLCEPEPERYRFHDLVRAHAASTCTATDTQAALDRLCEHYASTAAAAIGAVYPYGSRSDTSVFADERHARAWLEAELANVHAVAIQAARNGRGAHTAHQSEVLQTYLTTRGHYGLAEALHRCVADTGDDASRVLAMVRLGHTYRLRGNRAAATEMFDLANELASTSDDQRVRLTALLGVGYAHLLRYQYDSAARSFGDAVEVAGQVGDRRTEMTALSQLGNTRQLLGDRDSATRCLARALEMAREIGDSDGQVMNLVRLGSIHQLRGQHAAATDCYAAGMDIAKDTGYRNGELGTLMHLAYLELGRDRDARTVGFLTRALDLARDLGRHNAEADALWMLGRTHLRHGRTAPARSCFAEALVIGERIGDRDVQFESRLGLGRAGEVDQLGHLHAALDVAVQTDHQKDQVRAHDALGCAHDQRGQHERAREHWRTALTMLPDLGVDAPDDVCPASLRARLAERTAEQGAPR